MREMAVVAEETSPVHVLREAKHAKSSGVNNRVPISVSTVCDFNSSDPARTLVGLPPIRIQSHLHERVHKTRSCENRPVSIRVGARAYWTLFFALVVVSCKRGSNPSLNVSS